MTTNGGRCEVSTFHSYGYECTGALDGVRRAGRPHEWASRGYSPGAWFKAIFNDTYRIVKLRLTNRYGPNDEIKTVKVKLTVDREIYVSIIKVIYRRAHVHRYYLYLTCAPVLPVFVMLSGRRWIWLDHGELPRWFVLIGISVVYSTNRTLVIIYLNIMYLNIIFQVANIFY